MSGTMSIGGIASGLKTDDIIAKYMEIARRPQTQRKTEMEDYKQKLSVWQDLNTRVLALQASSESIASSKAFQTKTATSSMTDIATVSATTDAVAGSYYVKINKSAKSHQIASQTYTGLDAPIAEGSIKITVGSTSKDITIDSTNNTLLGAKDAINRADCGVRASIVNQGTTSNPQYSMILTSTSTGTDNKMIIEAGDTGMEINCDQDGDGNRVLVQAAEDAEIQMGSMTFTRSSNSISDVIPGVTINVTNPDDTKSVKIDVTQDSSSAKSAIQGFVKQYNDIMQTIKNDTIYDPETGDTGVLLGDFQLQDLQRQLEDSVTGMVSGIPTEQGKQTYNALSAIGITTGTDGQLAINDSELSSALANHPSDVAKLFGTTLESDSPYLSLVSSNSDTQPSGTRGYNVSITQPATRAWVRSGIAMDAKTLLNSETITINDESIALASGLNLDGVIAEINKSSSKTNVSAFISEFEGHKYLAFRSMQYGASTFKVKSSAISSDEASTTGLGTATSTPTSYSGYGEPGLDVVGTINGETCTGKGQVLTAAPENSDSPIKGLQIIATGSTPQSTQTRFIKGIGTSIKEILTKMTGTSGLFANTTGSLNEHIDAITKEIADMETSLTEQSDQMYAKFNAMESQLASLQQQGQSLTAQLSSLSTK